MDAEQTKVYVPDTRVGWVEATITKGHLVNDKTVEVILEGDDAEEFLEQHPAAGTIRTVPKSAILLQNESLSDDGCDDMVNLNYLHEPAILYNLKQRFFRQIPYTYTGPICIAVNPYAWLDLYSTEVQEQYLVKDRSELPPHVYATSAGSYHHMRMFGEDQSILVSGESGAGKTETTKILMSHLASAGGGSVEVNELERGIIDKVLQANPLMESFGNAKTSRNDNSSRFGKFSELQFNAIGQLIGARSRTYLLEKSRVSLQGQDERNYHIFYQLLAAPDDVTRQVKVQGMAPSDFPITEPRGEHVNDGMKDDSRFAQTMGCLSTLGVSQDDQIHILEIVATVLHLSRLEFEPLQTNEDASQLSNQANNVVSVSTVSELLGFPIEDLRTALCTRQMTAVADRYEVPLNVQQAQGVRTALATALYSHLFQWLIHRVNESTSARHEDVNNKICILDIFGFEIFEKNSFEQLCINYANEKLQQKFTQDVFKTVQTEYEEEGIPWTKIEFADNANVLSLIEGRFGVLSLLNEECMRPKGSDAAFANKLKAHYNDNDRFECPRFASDSFIIRHYAGGVQYETAGFLVKNTDALLNDLLVLISKSKSPFVKRLFPDEVLKEASMGSTANRSALKRRTSIIADTVGTQFKSQLNGLMEDIRRTNVHYVRCIKPNSRKSPFAFCKQRVTEQLQCAGVVEAVRISRCAFPNRMLQTVLLERFRGLARGAVPSVTAADPEEVINNAARQLLVEYLLKDKQSEYQLGKTRVFFRRGVLESLEELRSRKLNEAAVIVQRYARKWKAMASFFRFRCACVQVQAVFRGHLMKQQYKQQRYAAIKLQTALRRHVAEKLLVSMRKNHRATKIQNLFKMYVCRMRYNKLQKSIRKIQSIVRMFLAVRSFVVLQEQAREDAKLENQIRMLKQRLQEERDARMELEQDYRSSIMIRSDEMLEGADEVIDQLRRENAALKESNHTLKEANIQLRKEKEVMERGAYVNGASFAAANQRAAKLQEEVEMLKAAHAKIKTTHRLLKAQNLAAIEKVTALQSSLNEALHERNMLRQSVEHLTKHADLMQNENVALAKANARLRLILRQDPELSRKHREEVPRLTKLAFAAKQTLLPQRQQIQPPLPATPAPPVELSLSSSVKSPESIRPQLTQPIVPSSPLMTPIKRAAPAGNAKKAEGNKTQRMVSICEMVDDGTASTSSNPIEDSPVLTAAVAPKSPQLTSVRQPTGDDGPLLEPAKVMGLISEPESEQVSFSVTLLVDPAEEAKKEKERASLVGTSKPFTPNAGMKPVGGGSKKGRGRRGSHDTDVRYAHRSSYEEPMRPYNGNGAPMRGSYASPYHQAAMGVPNPASDNGSPERMMYTSSLRASFTAPPPQVYHQQPPAPVQQVPPPQQPQHGRGRRGSYDRSNLAFQNPVFRSRHDRNSGSSGSACTSPPLPVGGKRIEL